jgi:hypothetical protein
MAPAKIAPGNRADMIMLARSPFDDPHALRDVRLVVRGARFAPADAFEHACGAPTRSAADDDLLISLPCVSPCPPDR